ncbi:MAG: hypothetical protein WC519_01610 [Parcubacteria group bacterium]
MAATVMEKPKCSHKPGVVLIGHRNYDCVEGGKIRFCVHLCRKGCGMAYAIPDDDWQLTWTQREQIADEVREMGYEFDPSPNPEFD